MLDGHYQFAPELLKNVETYRVRNALDSAINDLASSGDPEKMLLAADISYDQQNYDLARKLHEQISGRIEPALNDIPPYTRERGKRVRKTDVKVRTLHHNSALKINEALEFLAEKL